jgi:hypothetical protein
MNDPNLRRRELENRVIGLQNLFYSEEVLIS